VKLTFALSIAVAALLALQTATAAELPLRQAQPAPAAKKCQLDGQDGVILPGSGICVRVSGYVSVQTTAGTVGTVGTVGKLRQIGAP
jgi:hypothetical protein